MKFEVWSVVVVEDTVLDAVGAFAIRCGRSVGDIVVVLVG